MAIQDIGVIYTPSIFGRTSFPLQHNGSPIFYKKFNGEDPNVVNVSSDTIFIENHFFKTGEPLKYSFSTGFSVGIASTSPGSGFSTTFPNTVYPIVVDKDRIRVAFSTSLAISNQYVNINSLGIGTQHSFEVFKQNSKSLITIDNLIQSPVSVANTVGITSFSDISITVTDLKNIKIGTNIRIANQEIVKVSAIDYQTKKLSLSRGVEILGTPQITFNSSNLINSYAEVLSGNYNIVKDKIYFTSSPLEGLSNNYLIETANIDFTNYNFSLFTNELDTGTQIFFYSINPPPELENGKKYYIVKNSNNNFSFASSLFNALNNIKISFSNLGVDLNPVEAFQLFSVGSKDGSNFQGRVFLRSDYSGNNVFDDVSEQFTGITSSFELKVSGISTVGIKSDNGIVLINNVFQYPESEEAFIFEEVGNTTLVKFLGSADYKNYDINVKGLPRGGIIISYGSTGGNNYQPLFTASGTATVSAGGTIQSVSIDNSGSGYRTGITTYYVTFDDGDGKGSGALGIANVTNGKVVSVNMVSGGSNYTLGISTYTPRFDSPINYENIQLSGNSSGIGALVSFEISPEGKVQKLTFTNNGYNYKVGEILTPVGILTSNNYNAATDQLKINIQQVAKDDFSAWNIGILQKLDDLSSKVNGRRKVFTLTETINNKSRRVSLESEPGSEIDLAYNLLVFINDVLQIPNKSYTFKGGSQISFTESVPLGSSLKVYFYKGSINDTQLFTNKNRVKEGDKLQIAQDIYSPPPVEQKSRTVMRILSSDTLRTEVYDDVGISESSTKLRSISWTPQKADLIINGEYVSKSRESIESEVIKLIRSSEIVGTFNGSNTNIIGINTTVGVGTNVQIGDYVEGEYLGYGITVVSIGSSIIQLSSNSESPVGVNTSLISFYKPT